MPKQTDMTGTYRVPEEAWGRFWNFMLTIPGADITPNTRAQAPEAKPKRANGSTKRGTSLKCIILNALLEGPKAALDITPIVVAAGRSKGSVHNTCYELVNAKHIAGDNEGYRITAAGRKYAAEHCAIT